MLDVSTHLSTYIHTCTLQLDRRTHVQTNLQPIRFEVTFWKALCKVRSESSDVSCAVCCSVLHCVAVCCRVLQCVAVCCSVLQCLAVCCRVLPCVAVCCSVLQCVAVCCSVLQCVAVCCSVLRCVAVCCSVLQHPLTFQ